MNTAIVGILGGGKTNLAVKMAFEDWKNNYSIISNTPLNFDGYKPEFMPNNKLIKILKSCLEIENMTEESIEKSKKILKDHFDHKTLVLDEVTNLIDARKASSDLNLLMTNFFMMSNKLSMHIIYTCQVLDSQADYRVRAVTNFIHEPMKFKLTNSPIFNERERILNYAIKILVIKSTNYGYWGWIPSSYSYDPTPYYKYYDTQSPEMFDRNSFKKI